MNPATSYIKIDILKPSAIAAKSSMSHMAGFLDLLLIKASANNLKFC